MQQDGILFYNISALVPSPEYPGQLLSRFTPALIAQMDVPTPAQWSRGCELRFWQMPQQEATTIYLYAIEQDAEVVVLAGEHFVRKFRLVAGQITPLSISMIERLATHIAIDENSPELRYPTTLYRLFFESETKVSYCGRDVLPNDVAAFGASVVPAMNNLMPSWPPKASLFLEDGSRNTEQLVGVPTPAGTVVAPVLPAPAKGEAAMYAKKRMLAYGSSITHGSHAIAHYNCYAQLTAQNLGCDLLNLGMSGACTCDHAMADYIASVPDVDFYYLELGVNMRGTYYAEQFEERVTYLLEKLKGRKIYMTTIYPNRASYFEVENMQSAQERTFNDILCRLAPLYGATLFEGTEILTNPMYLCHDLIHPTSVGHIKMAENLTRLLIQEK